MILGLEDVEKRRWGYWDQNKKVGLTSGCFDILHAGHLHVLNEAKRYCDILIVAVNTNDSVRQLKGLGRPINDATDRALLIDSLKPVDFVIYNSRLNNNSLVRILKPDFYIKSGEYSETSTSAALVEEYHGATIFIPVLPGYSSTKIIQKIKNVG